MRTAPIGNRHDAVPSSTRDSALPLHALPQTQRVKGKPKTKTTKFNRLLVYLFSSKSNSDILSSPPPSTVTVFASNPVLRLDERVIQSRPSTAPAATSREMPHTSHSYAVELPLDIIVQNDPVIIRGTGVDYEPGHIRGVVRLSLVESSDIKEIMIRCVGKARLAVMQKEGTRSQVQTQILHLKEEDLLEGDKSHPHTLKAGRHEFPFSFELDSRLAASLSANFGAAVIEYRLRAMAVRPSFSTNYIATKDFTLIRSFSNEALEFQQTLEIENTWPDKVQYTVILPHKAWAAGDHISAILKFTPLAKGVKVVSVKMNLQEKVKTVWRSTTHEEVRVVCSKKDTIKHGRPTNRGPSPAPATAPSTPDEQTAEEALQMNPRHRRQQGSSGSGNHGTSFFRRVGSRFQSRENLLNLGNSRGGTRTGDEPHLSGSGSGAASSPAEPSPSTSPPNSPIRSRSNSSSGSDNGNEDLEMVMRMRIPVDTTPSHNVAPVFVSHRIKWDVLISNLDGHFSELRCSLPIHLLAKEVLDETLAATNATRTALLGESHGVLVQEIVLPAYQDHLRDRVAIDELYEHTLATNPLNAPPPPLPTPSDEDPEAALVPLSSSYGPTSTLNDQFRTNVPRTTSMPDASERGRLRGRDLMHANAEAQSSELYLSLGRRPNTGNSADLPAGVSGSGSHPPSQSSSRASSPERMGEPSNRGTKHTFGIKPFTSVFKSKNSTPSSSRPPSRPSSSHKNPSSWTGGNKFPFSRSSSGPSTPSSPEPMHYPLPLSRGSNSPTSTQTSSMQTSSIQTASTSTSMSPSLGDYYDAVPEYAFAAQGFLGGGITPLSALRGLPSYDQAQRSKQSSPLSSGTTSQGSSTSHSSASRRRSGTGRSRLSGERRTSADQQQRRGSGERRTSAEGRGSPEQSQAQPASTSDQQA